MRAIIPSNFEAGRDLQRKILEEVARRGYDESSVFAIKLALEEGVVNAIRHGNKFDASKKVTVDYQVSDERVEVTIEDEGAGFRTEDVPDPTAEENLTKCSGRGILLIRAYMTSAEYTKGGRRLHMVKVKGG